jgi:two-component system, cell cycle sensor histidine kinase and response regulator CckA
VKIVRNSIAGIIVIIVVLLSYVSFLLTTNYTSQTHLQQIILEQFRLENSSRATLLSYFFNDWRQDILNLASSREIDVFFENRALGMSMEYGLGQSLPPIKERFTTLIGQHRMSVEPVFCQIVLLDEAGQLLVRTSAPGRKITLPTNMKLLRDPAYRSGAVIVDDHNRAILISTAYFFKGTYAGQIIAWINPDYINQSIIISQNGSERKTALVETASGTSFPAVSWPIIDLVQRSNSLPIWFEDKGPGRTQRSMMGICLPVKETPFVLITVAPANAILGKLDPRELLIGMGILAVVIIGGGIYIIRAMTRSLVLRTKLETSLVHEQEVQEKNLQLEQEIAERKRAEAEVRASESKFFTIFSLIPDPTTISDLETGKVIDLNEAAARWFGLSRDEATGLSTVDMKLWADPADRHRLQTEMQEKGKIVDQEFKFRKRSGEVRQMLFSANFLEVSGKKYLLGCAHDITERKRAEEALYERNAWINSILEASPAAIYAMDKEGVVLSWNRGAEQMFGWSKEETVGSVLPIVQAEDFEDFRANTNKILRGEMFVGVELQRRRKDGSFIDISISAAPLYGSSGEVKGIMSVASDLTQHKKLEAERSALESQLRQVQKMEAIGQLGGGVAHDFNNILSAIVGYSHLSLMQMDAGDPNRKNIEQILASADRAAVLTQRLLAFSRKQTVKLSKVNLNDIIARFETFLLRLLREDIEFVTIFAQQKLPVLADSSQMEQVLMNLVTNSRDAMPQGGRIIVKTDLVELGRSFIKAHGYGQEGNYALISITDTGIGIPDNHKDKIFEPFFTTKAAGKGTGLGLSMVYGIVKKHEGHIDVSTQPSIGTTFSIYLPLAHDGIEASDQKDAERNPVRRGTETVLIAEDDAALRTLTATVLSQYGYTVIEASDGSDAVAKFNENRDSIRLVILDGIMPKMNGKAAWEKIKALSSGVKAIFISGYAEDIFTKDGIPDRGTSFIQKPYPPMVLATRVREVLDE